MKATGNWLATRFVPRSTLSSAEIKECSREGERLALALRGECDASLAIQGIVPLAPPTRESRIEAAGAEYTNVLGWHLAHVPVQPAKGGRCAFEVRVSLPCCNTSPRRPEIDCLPLPGALPWVWADRPQLAPVQPRVRWSVGECEGIRPIAGMSAAGPGAGWDASAEALHSAIGIAAVPDRPLGLELVQGIPVSPTVVRAESHLAVKGLCGEIAAVQDFLVQMSCQEWPVQLAVVAPSELVLAVDERPCVFAAGGRIPLGAAQPHAIAVKVIEQRLTLAVAPVRDASLLTGALAYCGMLHFLKASHPLELRRALLGLGRRRSSLELAALWLRPKGRRLLRLQHASLLGVALFEANPEPMSFLRALARVMQRLWGTVQGPEAISAALKVEGVQSPARD
jgi:hypothetical protein